MEVTDLAVHKSVTVDVTVERAFEVFTDRIDDWWIRAPSHRESRTGPSGPRAPPGGRWYEVGVDGSECDWGHVVAWEPPTRLVLAWQIGADWKFDPDLLTEVEVRFVDLGDNRTRVDLEHRDLTGSAIAATTCVRGSTHPAAGRACSTHSSRSSDPPGLEREEAGDR